MLIRVLFVSTPFFLVVADAFRFDPSSSSLLTLPHHAGRQQQQHPQQQPAWRPPRRRPRPRPGIASENSFDLVCRSRREEQLHLQRLSMLFSSLKNDSGREDEEKDEATGAVAPGRMLDPAAIFRMDRGQRGAKSAAAAAAHERSLQNKNQILGLLSDPVAARAWEGSSAAQVSVIDNESNEGDDDDDGSSIALDAEEYVMASNSNDRGARNEMLVGTLSGDGKDSARWRGVDETAINDWAVDLDPAYKAVLETLVNVNPAVSEDDVKGGLSTTNIGGQGGATVQDLVRILEAQQSETLSDARRKAMMQLGNAAAADDKSPAERLHDLVFENEDGFWNQSDAFRNGLTDPANRGAARQVLAERRGAVFEERNRASLQKLENQLDQLQRSIDVPTSDPKGALANRCPRCRSVLTDLDVELMQRRDTRLCPVCTAEVRLVPRYPTGTATTTSTFASRGPFRTHVAAPSSMFRDGRMSGNRRVYRTTPVQQRHLGDSKAPPVAAPAAPSETSSSSSTAASPLRRDESLPQKNHEPRAEENDA